MSKRRLTEQQRRRITTMQYKRISQQHLRLAEHAHSKSLGLEKIGLVIANLGQQLEVETDVGVILRCFTRQNLGDIVAGDIVTLVEQSDGVGIITAVHNRKNILVRPDKYKQRKTLNYPLLNKLYQEA